ncbi:MAG: pilus assembly protein N-terminal domain-containing protein [Planctomycetales bacterium]|nr:pilus assembly protein N-terminal domain-containing protein [Planctomycetales bacterium]
MDLVQGAPTTTATGPAEMARQELPSTGLQLSARGSNAGLVQPSQPLQLSSAAAESVLPPSGIHQNASTTVARAPVGRIPELVQASKSMSVAKPISTRPSVSLKLSDSPTAESTSSHAAVLNNESPGASSTGDRSVSLHLSSASQVPLKASPVSVQLPRRAPGMQVRVEGEPAPLMTAQAIRGSDHDLPSAPLPSMAPKPRIASVARAELPSLGKKVKASFASRTTQLPDREPLALVETREQKSGPPGETLSVGLQESQALSAEYPIMELSVEHPTICQLMQTGEKSVSLIGMRPGSTRIALITVNGNGDRQVEIHEVSVGTSAPSELGLAGLAKEISRAVAKMVPHSDVEIVAYSDYLLVHGFTPYESDAKKILALVRKTSLVPVVDQLKTNER